jgi:hypothetical protein
MYPTLLAYCQEMGAALARLLAYAGAIVVLGLIAAKMCGPPPVEAAVAVTIERADWLAATGAPQLRGRHETREPYFF